MYGSPNAGLVIADKEGKQIVLDIDETYSVAEENATYETSDATVVTVSDEGIITAHNGGNAFVRVVTATGSTKYPVTVWRAIATETDFMKIYESPSGYYKLANDVTLTAFWVFWTPNV